MQQLPRSESQRYRRRIICTRCNEYRRSSPEKKLKLCEACCIATGAREKDERARSRRTFPFFRLPCKLREIIYRELYVSSHQNCHVTPDPHSFRRNCSIRHVSQTLNTRLSLLQTCQQAYDEATPILYGSNTFCFSDEQYEYKTVKCEGFMMHCDWCKMRIEQPKGYDSYEDRCFDIMGGVHWVEVPLCDYVLQLKRFSESFLSFTQQRSED